MPKEKKKKSATKVKIRPIRYSLRYKIKKIKVSILPFLITSKHYFKSRSSEVSSCLVPMVFNWRYANKYIPKFSQIHQSWYEINPLTSLHFWSGSYQQPYGEAGLIHTYWSDKGYRIQVLKKYSYVSVLRTTLLWDNCSTFQTSQRIKIKKNIPRW